MNQDQTLAVMDGILETLEALHYSGDSDDSDSWAREMTLQHRVADLINQLMDVAPELADPCGIGDAGLLGRLGSAVATARAELVAGKPLSKPVQESELTRRIWTHRILRCL